MVDRREHKDEIESRDGCLEEETRFGAYAFVMKSAQGLNELLRTGLGLMAEDLYIEVHVPDPVEGTPRSVLDAFRDGMLELADFLNEKRLEPRWLIGITHQYVARPAQRFLNFQVISGIPKESVDGEKTQRIAEGYSKAKRRKNETSEGPLYLCYQSYASFMEFAESLRGKKRAQQGLTTP